MSLPVVERRTYGVFSGAAALSEPPDSQSGCGGCFHRRAAPTTETFSIGELPSICCEARVGSPSPPLTFYGWTAAVLPTRQRRCSERWWLRSTASRCSRR
jgi:hypothetical protein